MDAHSLQDQFGIPGALSFDETASGLLRANISTPSAEATLYLQGAHLTHWQPTGQRPVLFTSGRSDFALGKPIRGGIPVIFPWFADRKGAAGPSHGFARVEKWQLAFAAIAGDDLHLTMTLGPSAQSRRLGYDRFRLAYTLAIGRTLALQLAVANDSDSPLIFEEALHTYFAVEDVRGASISGLEGSAYLDKVDAMRRKQQAGAPIRFTGRRDEVHLNTQSACMLTDEGGKRSIAVEKTGSNSTIVWNPWAELAATLPDMEADGWQRMVCIETANVAENAITLAPGESHSMRVAMSVEALKS
ncbi:MAG: D-hexose-6-phosphate mutarotase [Acidobacteriaceae bacterium]